MLRSVETPMGRTLLSMSERRDRARASSLKQPAEVERLPATRSNYRRHAKAQILAAIRSGEITRGDALVRYGISAARLVEWERHAARTGKRQRAGDAA